MSYTSTARPFIVPLSCINPSPPRLDCSLRELMSLIREVNPDTRPKGTLFSFSTVYPDMRRGGYRLKDLGQTLSGKRGMDDDTTLYSRKFQIGDFVDVAVTPKSRNRPY